MVETLLDIGVERSITQVLNTLGREIPLLERVRRLSCLLLDDLRVLFRPGPFPVGSVESTR